MDLLMIRTRKNYSTVYSSECSHYCKVTVRTNMLVSLTVCSIDYSIHTHRLIILLLVYVHTTVMYVYCKNPTATLQ